MNKNLVVISGINDIASIDLSVASYGTKHLAITCEYSDVRCELMELLAEHDVYSLILVSSKSDAFAEDAITTDKTPFFYASSLSVAGELIGQLTQNPMKVVTKAINGEDVAINFSQGYPS